ncbi:DNA-binding transcriptional regulator, AcrR family [Thermomonospora echinospora]|uniref:DNA-binding transcriptional regulator, AcrR family n=1 Tax=Thermomonospora echinospora TaxID=1992 RepID=A0A1H5X805_9ACTN|nr:TetR/AcrR family transcriptional regulator [Thermomonospora echinospora]SEG07881.1 DNA-binding transcriptional regulator, AcrR family [Thermomonospora echinospora]
MTSKRHKQTDDDALLDAARDCVLAVGVRRTTLTDIARRAGVSRMTLYRRWPDVRSIVADLMTREWTGLAVEVSATARHRGTGSARERLVDHLSEGVRSFRAHPLLRKIVDVDPELLLPYVLQRRGTSQEAFCALLAAGLRAGHADGSVRPGHPVRQARTLLLIAQSFALSVPTMVDDEHTTDAFDAEFREILERVLKP